jgi:CheY-like chemotaxis protein
MPGLDGWELFEEIRKRPATARVPFVFLTTERDLPQRLRGFHMGAPTRSAPCSARALC